MDLLDFWVHDTYPDILFLTKTWLRGSIMNKDIGIGDYNIFRCDILKKKSEGWLYMWNQCMFSKCHYPQKSVCL